MPQPALVSLNRPLAKRLGMDPNSLSTPQGIEFLAGKRIAAGSEPLAMAYAGHQFGSFVPSLGDGRAVLLGEIVAPDGVRFDIHLKGAGRTPFSRMGDGRAALGPVLREYVISEAMAALGVPTTRALAMLTTGEEVYRERAEPGAILVRIAESHVRIGTFEYFHRRGDHQSVRKLADYVIARHYPCCAKTDQPYRVLLDEIVVRQAELIPRWMLVGFIHGVMNTDNTSIVGETIDYGPCAFMDTYSPDTVDSSIDHFGRYAFNQQPRIALWNLAQLAQTFLPLLDEDENKALSAAQEALDDFAPRFQENFHAGLQRKIGLTGNREGDTELAFDLLHRMSEQRADFTNTFRSLCELGTGYVDEDHARREFVNPEVFDEWAAKWRQRLAAERRGPMQRRAAMRAVNPAFIPRNHRVQQAIEAATGEETDLGPLEALLAVIAQPFEEHPELAGYARAPRPEEAIGQTYCGT